MAQKLIDIVGNKYNMLTVIAFDHIGDRRRSYWKCRCDCGNEVILRKDMFIYPYSKVKSCGCWHIKESRMRANANRNKATGRIEKQ